MGLCSMPGCAHRRMKNYGGWKTDARAVLALSATFSGNSKCTEAAEHPMTIYRISFFCNAWPAMSAMRHARFVDDRGQPAAQLLPGLPAAAGLSRSVCNGSDRKRGVVPLREQAGLE